MAELRKKAKANLTEEICRILEGVVDNFLKKDGDEAEEAIWRICYQPETEMMWMGFPENISEEDVRRIREELASQYRTAHKEWKYGQYFQGSEHSKTESAKKLWISLKENRFAFDTIMQKLLEKSYADEEEIEHTLRCLQSRADKSKFGGAKSLGFGYSDSEWLKKVANEMGDVLEDITREKMIEYRAKKESEKNAEFPFVYEEEAIINNQNKVENESKLEPVRAKGLSPLELIQNRESIEAFYGALSIIAHTPNAEWLAANQEQVEAFYKHCDQL